MSHTEPIKPISNRVRKQYRVFSRRKLAELRTFYRGVMNTPQTSIAVRMNAAERLQELFQMELEERQLLDSQEREQEPQGHEDAEVSPAQPAQPVAAAAPEEPSLLEQAERNPEFARSMINLLTIYAEKGKETK